MNNRKHQNRHQYDFLNPEERKNLHLNDKRAWIEVNPVNFSQRNNHFVKQVQSGVQAFKEEAAKHQEEQAQSKFRIVYYWIAFGFKPHEL